MTKDEQLERAVSGRSLSGRPPKHWNEGLMRAFLDRIRADGLTVNSQLTQVFGLAHFARWLNEKQGKDLRRATPKNVTSYLATSGLQPGGKADRSWLIGKAYRIWAEEGLFRGGNPASNHRTTGRKGNRNKLQASDLLSEEEAFSIIEATDHPRDTALLGLLWDSGARIDEILSLDVEDVKTHPDYPDGLLVVIRTSKTEPRELAVFDAVPWLVPWLERNPYRDDPKAPLFYNFARNREDSRLTDDGARVVLRTALERARRNVPSLRGKRVFLHLFRHSRATHLLRKGYNESALKQRMGWSFATKMMARYVHWAARDHHAEEARLAGKEPLEKAEPRLRPRCRACRFENAPGARFCARCLRGLELGKEMVKVQSRRALEKRLDSLERINASLGQMMVKANPEIAKLMKVEDPAFWETFWEDVGENLDRQVREERQKTGRRKPAPAGPAD